MDQHLPRTAGTRARVLLAAPAGDGRAALERALVRSWLAVDAVEHGAAALDALRGGAYDAAVLAADLPGLSGTAVCRWVREHGADRDLPVLVLVGDDPGSGADEAAAAGASGTLPLDARPRLVAHRVVALLRHAHVPLPRQRGIARALPFLRGA
ncbi:response regulator [Vallicoccus soli]|uniref:response regulator n=1 Tax=Vallicoccus soli TaxID=2339232 RepID=UPI0014028BFA|nr:response regulator [Vallicoccus soli]